MDAAHAKINSFTPIASTSAKPVKLLSGFSVRFRTIYAAQFQVNGSAPLCFYKKGCIFPVEVEGEI